MGRLYKKCANLGGYGCGLAPAAHPLGRVHLLAGTYAGAGKRERGKAGEQIAPPKGSSISRQEAQGQALAPSPLRHNTHPPRSASIPRNSPTPPPAPPPSILHFPTAAMFEARLTQGRIFKALIESIKDLVSDANIDCTEEGISIQAMDSSHVSLVSVVLRASGFDHFRCDRGISLGFNSANMSKILKCAGNEDVVTLKAEDEGDTLTLMCESESQDRIADFELKLMDIDSEQLGIPDTDYKCTVKMPSTEFQRIIRDLQVLGDTCAISCTKEGIKFSVTGDLGTGNVLIRSNATAEKEEEQVIIDMQEPVDLTFALRYLNFFTKATQLGPTVIISMSPDVPVVVEYPIEDAGEVKFYLAPKIDEGE